MVVEPAVVDSKLAFVITAVSGVGDPVVADGCVSADIVVVEASVVVVVEGSVAKPVLETWVEVEGSVVAAIVLEASVEVGASRSVVAIDVEVTGGCVVRPAIVDDASVVVDG